jgi:misacylated tRNA(Ala) deacylase
LDGPPRIPSRSFYHDHPCVLTLQTQVVEARPGRVLLAQSPFFPGGGGQLPDRGVLRWDGGEETVTGFELSAKGLWLLLAKDDVQPIGPVEAAVDADFRQLMRELHTSTHILNAVVFREFNGALVTGAQMAADGTARMDFDLPYADNDRLRAIEPLLNDAIRLDLSVTDTYVPLQAAQQEYGLIRNRSVAPPPTTDGQIRLVEIVGLDRQACGGTHLGSTGSAPSIRILKIDNKGRHNRRVYIALRGRSAPVR